MTALDATGLRALEELAETLRRSNRCLILCGARHQPAQLIARADFHRHVGDANICAHLHDALERATIVHEHQTSAPLGTPSATA
jgi:MFS superfamily sulfate permease-like transporter